MSAAPGRLLLLFLDGVGIGDDDPRINPWLSARLPALRHLFGGSIPTLGSPGATPPPAELACWVAADATLGIPGRPQSGTGQTSLLTGENAAARFGRHFGPWVPTGVRDLLARRNVLSRARAAGLRPAFANAHPAGAPAGRRTRRPAAPALAAEAAGVLNRHEEALREGRAVASSITHEGWQRYLPGFPGVSPPEAGAALARICGHADVTLFAHYDTDLVGHRRDLSAGVAVLERVDGFVSGLLDALPADTLLIVASDHGNLEDASAGHTVNPVPVIASGPGAGALVGGVRSIMDVAPAMLAMLNVD